MNQTLKIRQSAIDRHDIDAPEFQNSYVHNQNKFASPFLYGREFIIAEIDELLAQLPAGASILDIGCGTGHLTQYMQAKGFKVFGLEPAANMLTLAKKNFPDIEFKQGVSAELPYPDNTFDAIIAIEVLRYLSPEDVVKSYQEMHRVLKTGGRFMLTHVNRYASDLYLPFYYLKRLKAGLVGRAYHYCYFTSGAKETAILKKLGFSSSEAYGRMIGVIRLAYLFGKNFGTMIAKWFDKTNPQQKFSTDPNRSLAGHLIVKAEK